MQNTTTTTQTTKKFQVYFTNRFRNRDSRAVIAKDEFEAAYILEINEIGAKNIHAQEITEDAFAKIAEGKQNPCAAVSGYWEN